MNSQKGGEFGFDILYFGKSTTSGDGNGNLFQYSCLENPMDRRACWVKVHGVAESDVTEAT